MSRPDAHQPGAGGEAAPSREAGRRAPSPSDLAVAARRQQRSARRAEARRRRRARRSVLWRNRRLAYLVGLVVVVTGAGAGAVVTRIELPAVDERLAETTFVCAADVDPAAGQVCGPDNALVQLAAEQDRSVVDYEQVPELVIDAVVAAEDRDFFGHRGVDPTGIARAALADLRGSESLQGGSTITQQYVKQTYLSDEQTILRKFREAVLAVKLERKYSKQEILGRYLNSIYFGRGAYGVQAAARAYFGVDVGDLAIDAATPPERRVERLARAAYLAGLIRAPETADALADPAEADFRRSSVLDAMVEEGYVSATEARAAEALPWQAPAEGGTLVGSRPDRSGLGPVRYAECGTAYVVDWVRQQLLDLFADRLYTEGYRVYLSLDPQAQCEAQAVLYGETLTDPATDPSASLVALDQFGHVVALVGGRDYQVSQVNLALGAAGGGSGRQPGSAFKPFVLAQAMQSGTSPLSRYPAPDEIVIPGADDGLDWHVKGGGNQGAAMTLLDATASSSNTVYAQLMMDLGPQGWAQVAALAGRMGITSPLPANPSLVLGTSEVSVLDLASAYQTLANRGERLQPQVVLRVEDADGNTVWEPAVVAERVLDTQVADAVTTALRGVVRDGTGQAARTRLDAAGKTGTTEDHRDAWFVGYTCDLTVAVWMGFEGRDGQPVGPMLGVRGVEQVTGGSFPAQMWSAFVDRATAERADCSLQSTRQFPGRVLNQDLSTVPTTSPPTTTAPAPATTGAPTEPAPEPTTTTAAVAAPPATEAAPTGGGGAPTGQGAARG